MNVEHFEVVRGRVVFVGYRKMGQTERGVGGWRSQCGVWKFICAVRTN